MRIIVHARQRRGEGRQPPGQGADPCPDGGGVERSLLSLLQLNHFTCHGNGGVTVVGAFDAAI